MLLWLYSFNNCILCWLRYKMYMLCLYQYISVFEQKLGPKLREMVLAPFRKRNSFINSRKDGEFGKDLVDSMLNNLQTLKLANSFSVIYFHMKTNITIPSDAQMLINDLRMRPLWNCYTRPGVSIVCVLSKESTQSVPNLTSFLKSLQGFHFLKGASIISLNLSPYYCSSA